MRDAPELEVNGRRRLMRRRQRVVLISVIAFTTLGVCLNTFTRPVYRATVRLELRRPADQPSSAGEPSFQSENLAMVTAAELITNRTLLERLVNEFHHRRWIEPYELAESRGLARLIPWLPSLAGAAGRTSFAAPAASAAMGAAPALLEARVRWLKTIVGVEPVRDTRLVDIKVEHNDPEAARAIADRLARLFVEYQSRRAAGPDGNLAPQAPAEIADVEQGGDPQETLSGEPDFAPRAALEARIKRLDERIAFLNAEHARAQDETVEASARMARLESFVPDSGADWSGLPAEGEALNGLRGELLDCQTRLAVARGIYKEKHPRLQALESEWAIVLGRAREERDRAIAAVGAEQRILAARERDLGTALSLAERERSEAEERVQRYLVRRDDPLVEVVDPAAVSPDPVRPRKAMNLAVCPAAGLLIGWGLALLRYPARRTIRGVEDFEEQLKLPVLGVIPKKNS